MSSIERLKRKKAGTLNTGKDVTELTELANQILNTGNMDVYQETFEQITQKLDNHKKRMSSKANIIEADSDMFSDNFESEKKPSTEENVPEVDNSSESKDILWEFKWDQNSDKVIDILMFTFI